jgi:succinyl-CoA synthetase beta subunit
MRLFEFESKRIFKTEGIPVPRGEVTSSSEAAARVASAVGFPAILKAQVPVGRRAKAGAIRVVKDTEGAAKAANEILGTRVHGFEVRRLLVEEYLPVAKELYFSATIDDSKGKPVVLASSEGGTEIEETAARSPEKIFSLEVDPLSEFEQDQARQVAMGIGLEGDLMSKVSNIVWLLYRIFAKYDATIAEINPLVVTADNGLFAAGTVLAIDDDALYRHAEIPIDPEKRIHDDIEREAAELGIAYVRLDGDIGVIGSGAGLAMATIDLITDYGGAPANFLDTGGRITQEHIRKCLDIVTKNPKVSAILANMYGGINPMIEAAKGIAEFVREKQLPVPLVAKIRGNFEEEAWDILEHVGVRVVKTTQTEDAARLAVALSKRSH